MTRSIVPIRSLTQRPVELGRIRIGVKGPEKISKKGTTYRDPMSIDSFRFTSADKTALEQVAEHYGGTVQPWSDDKVPEGQYEVITEAPEIRIGLPDNPLGGTPMYELYGGGGRERWCDGETCEVWEKGPDGPEPSDVPCKCLAAGELACKPTVHLSVVLPDVRGIGVWRLTTHSWNAAQEMPAMVRMIHGLQSEGIQRAVLRIERKRSVQAGQTRKFPVPTLGLDASIEQLMAGENAVGRLQAAAVPEIGAGPKPVSTAGEPPAPDDHHVGISESEEPDGVNTVITSEGGSPAPPESFNAQLSAAVDDDVVEAEIVDEALDELRSAIGLVPGLGEARVLKRARRIALDNGWDQPESFEGITGPTLDAVYAEVLAKVGS